MSSTGFESAFITGDITTDKKTNEIKLKFSILQIQQVWSKI